MCSFIEYKDDLKIVYKRYARYCFSMPTFTSLLFTEPNILSHAGCCTFLSKMTDIMIEFRF